MKNIAIKGNSDERIAKLIIEKLESLGKNKYDVKCKLNNHYYFIGNDGTIDCDERIPFDYTEYDIMQDIEYTSGNAMCDIQRCAENCAICKYSTVELKKEVKEQPKQSKEKCLLCNREFKEKIPHNCNSGYRKHNIKWQPKSEYPKTMMVSNNNRNWCKDLVRGCKCFDNKYYYWTKGEQRDRPILWEFAKDIEPKVKSAEEVVEEIMQYFFNTMEEPFVTKEYKEQTQKFLTKLNNQFKNK